MLTKNTTHQYTQAEINRFSLGMAPEMPTEFQMQNSSRSSTVISDYDHESIRGYDHGDDHDENHDEDIDISNFMEKSFDNMESDHESVNEFEFGLGSGLFFFKTLFTFKEFRIKVTAGKIRVR